MNDYKVDWADIMTKLLGGLETRLGTLAPQSLEYRYQQVRLGGHTRFQ